MQNGNTALDIARDNQKQEIVQLLESFKSGGSSSSSSKVLSYFR